MKKIDYQVLDKTLNKDNTKVAYEENKHMFTKVAFDVFQLNSSPIESYWVLEKGEDGKEYLVAKYEENVVEGQLESKASWQALSDKEANNVTLLYKQIPIKRFAAEDYGFSAEDVNLFIDALTNKLASDHSFVDKMLNSLSIEKTAALKKQFPELTNQD